MKKNLLLVAFIGLFCWSCVTPGGVISTVGSAPSGSAPAQQSAAPESKAFKTPMTFKNLARNFQYTIPAGWYKVDGEPDSESVSFMKEGGTLGFIIHITQMVPSFPRKDAVKAGLKQDTERMSINQVLEARRRDDGDAKKKCGVIGWEQVEAPQKNSFQRIIWQCYDGENYYMNFMAHSTNEDFAAAKPTLRQIMDSIKFCVN